MDLLEYDPEKINISSTAYDNGEARMFRIEVQQSKKAQVIRYLFDTFGKDRLFELDAFDGKPANIWATDVYLLTDGRNLDVIKTEKNGKISAKKFEGEKRFKDDGYVCFSIMGNIQLDEIQSVDIGVEYENFDAPEVYAFMSNVQITPRLFDKNTIKERKPVNVRELAYCVSNSMNVTKKDIPHFIKNAITYYKIAKLQILGLWKNRKK